ncbi:cell surface protein [Listeria grandensis FSL F6-0971]|uniref:Cell surface protein n=1 Tax=Listeria grandensis FSL F6-0971 TaxID=1265819 RepID=W7BHY2_9LIST|nr:WxL domain-containing protein [Listeria grandensis]EUJ24405.1 cell surface protein [Listeria grandensis FSL F6-0971]
MMKQKKMMAGLTIFGMTISVYAAGAGAAEFDGPDKATSEATVNVLPGSGVVNPPITNPIDPELPELPIDPVNPIEGPLRINYVSDLNFDDHTLTGREETIFSNDDVVGDTTIPAFVNVADLRGTGTGWTLKVSQTGELVEGGELQFKPVYNGADDKITTVGGNLNSDGDEIDIAIASENGGMGSNSILLGGTDGVALVIPHDAKAGDYNAALHWNVVADPTT